MKRHIRRGEQELEPSGYGAEVLTFLGLASLDGITFAALRDVGGPTGLHHLVNDAGPRFPPRIGAALGKLPSSRQGLVIALQKKGLSIARNLVRHKIRFLAG